MGTRKKVAGEKSLKIKVQSAAHACQLLLEGYSLSVNSEGPVYLNPAGKLIDGDGDFACLDLSDIDDSCDWIAELDISRLKAEKAHIEARLAHLQKLFPDWVG